MICLLYYTSSRSMGQFMQKLQKLSNCIRCSRPAWVVILWTGLAVSGIWEACARSFTHKSDASLLTAEMELSTEAFIFPFHSFFGCSDGLFFL